MVKYFIEDDIFAFKYALTFKMLTRNSCGKTLKNELSCFWAMSAIILYCISPFKGEWFFIMI